MLADKAELAKTSSQDEFAKWAKLKRKLDKGLADLEKISELWHHVACCLCWTGSPRSRGFDLKRSNVPYGAGESRLAK